MKNDLGIDDFGMWLLMCSLFALPKRNQAVNSTRSSSAGFLAEDPKSAAHLQQNKTTFCSSNS